MGKSQIIKSRERVKKFGEVFTPPEVVEGMLALLPDSTYSPYTAVLEPSCGEGVFLEHVLRKKLLNLSTDCPAMSLHEQIERCLSSIYGIDIQRDNVEICRGRLVDTCISFVDAIHPDQKLRGCHISGLLWIVDHNVAEGDFLQPHLVTMYRWRWGAPGTNPIVNSFRLSEIMAQQEEDAA